MPEKVIILYVEPEESLSQLMADELSRVGYVVYTEDDAQKALGFIKKNKEIKIVLISLYAEASDELELLKSVKSLRPEVEIIVITSSQDEKYLNNILASGAFEYVQKPFALSQFITLLKRCEEKIGNKNDPPIKNDIN